MYFPALSDTFNRHSTILPLTSNFLDTLQFSLIIVCVLGIFGGDEAFSAMATIHIYKGRRWMGWYNSPGPYRIAKRYGLVPTSKFFRGVFPGARADLNALLEFDGGNGPGFQAVRSGTIIGSTEHLASVLMKQCAVQEVDEEFSRRDGQSVRVSVVDLKPFPPRAVELDSLITYSPFFAIIPIFASLTACIASAFYEDWIAFMLILWGILSNGISCLVIGSGTLRFTHHIPPPGCPPGDGILGSGNELVLVRGDEGAVNSITRGKLSLEFPSNFKDEYIGYCSVLLTIQFIIQLFLIPQASPFGQVIFICSLAVSWAYNSWLSSFDTEEIKRRALWNEILQIPSCRKYNWCTRTSAVVFALCILSRTEDPSRFLEAYLPNNTKVWKQWKETLLGKLHDKKELQFEHADWDLEDYSDAERNLLETLYRDAQDAYDASRRLIAVAVGNHHHN